MLACVEVWLVFITAHIDLLDFVSCHVMSISVQFHHQIERLDLLEQNVDVKSYPRVCLYLMTCVPYVPGTYKIQQLVNH
jgi:hypothetical protein